MCVVAENIDAAARGGAPQKSDEGRLLMATPTNPTFSVSTPRTLRRPGVMGTAEIKARIEAIYVDDRRPVTRTAR